MPKPMPANGLYTGRRAEKAVLNITVEREAACLIREWAPSQMGALVSRWAFEHQARLEERARLLAGAPEIR